MIPNWLAILAFAVVGWGVIRLVAVAVEKGFGGWLSRGRRKALLFRGASFRTRHQVEVKMTADSPFVVYSQAGESVMMSKEQDSISLREPVVYRVEGVLEEGSYRIVRTRDPWGLVYVYFPSQGDHVKIFRPMWHLLWLFGTIFWREVGLTAPVVAIAVLVLALAQGSPAG